MITAALEAIGVIGPGLPDWASAVPILRGQASWVDAPVVVPAPARLPPAERRRVGVPVRLACAVAEQAFAATRVSPADARTVFSSSLGDGENCHALCEALAQPDPSVSPTRFTNSVQNAPAGYWSIGERTMAASTSVCAMDASFAAGLLEAGAQLAFDGLPVALVAHDSPYPQPLAAARSIPFVFAVALVLADPRRASAPLAWLRIGAPRAGEPSLPSAGPLATMAAQVAAARALPLLEAIAGGRPMALRLAAGAGRVLPVDVSFAPPAGESR